MSTTVVPSEDPQSSWPTTPDDEYEGYFGFAQDAAKAFVLGQAYESVSQDGVRRIVNKQWVKQRKSILTLMQGRPRMICTHASLSRAEGYQAGEDSIKEGQTVYS